jgi:hypothetical protein
VEREANGFGTVHRLAKEALSIMNKQIHMEDVSPYIFDIVSTTERSAHYVSVVVGGTN